MCQYEEQWVIGGFLSWSEPCGTRNRPTVFADAYSELDWMKSVIAGTFHTSLISYALPTIFIQGFHNLNLILNLLQLSPPQAVGLMFLLNFD
jgi:hypothetical protein